tara:strand:- start:14 stop:214 length:201 start_codon:yes stop_codon:yes gene_type:complete
MKLTCFEKCLLTGFTCVVVGHAIGFVQGRNFENMFKDKAPYSIQKEVNDVNSNSLEFYQTDNNLTN